jgi:hypothetical protein
LAAALVEDKSARAFFESLGRTDQYAVILRYRRREARPAVQLRWGGWSPCLRAGQRVN